MNDAYRQIDIIERRIARIVTGVVVVTLAAGVWLLRGLWLY